MIKPTELWRHLTDAPPSQHDPDLRRRTQLLLGLVTVLIPLGFLSISVEALLFPQFWPTFYLVAAALSALLLVYGLARTGRFLGAALIAVAVTTATSFAIVMLNRSDVMAYAFLYLGVFLAGLLFAETGVWVTALTTVVGVTVVLPAWGVPPPQGDPVSVPIFLVIASALLLISIRHRNAVERDRRVELAASAARMARAEEVAHLGSWELDLTQNRLVWSSETYRIFEIDPTRFGASYEAFLAAIHPDDREAVAHAYDESVRNRTRYDIVHRLRMPDGRVKYVQECCETSYDARGRALRSVGTVQDITERQLAEQRTQSLNRLLSTLAIINPILLRAQSEAQLFAETCEALVGRGEFFMAWIGLADWASGCVRPVAHAGFEAGYLERADIRCDDSPQGRGPTGTAIRSGAMVVSDDTETDEHFAPWRERARRLGIRSTVALPLSVQRQVIGSLNVYAAAPHAFGDREVLLLEKLAGDIGMALERLRNTARIEASERELATILQNMQDTYYRTDLDGRIVRASAAATKLLNHTPQEMEGRRLADFYVDPDGRARFLAALEAAGGALQNYEAALRHRDGSAIWVSTNAQYVRDAAGRVIGVEGTVRNISERKQAEQALRASEARYRTIVETAQEGIWTIDAESRTTFVNRKMAEILGYTVEEMQGRSIFDFLDAEGRKIAARNVERRKQGIAEQHEFEFRRKDGARLWAELNTSPLYDAMGGYVGALAMVTDITERRRSEQALRAREAEYRQLFENMTSGFALHEIICDDQGRPVDYRYLQANPAFERLTGVPAATLIGKRIREILPDTEDYWIETFGRVALTGEPAAYENYSREFGRYYDTWVFSPKKNQFAVIFTDITQRKIAEAEMRKLSSAVEQIADTVMITSREGVIEYVNPAFERTTGYTRTEALGQNPRLVKSGKQGAPFYQKLWQTILAGEIFNDVFINRRKDGSMYYEEKTISPLKDAAGRITHFVSTGKDVTERVQTEERLQHMAQHDALTELPNRALLLDRLKQSMARARWHQRLVAVLFVDLDRFKTINDTLGHDIGDRLLQQLAERFGRCVREGDTVARFGGDEFVILLDDVASDQDVVGVAQKALDVLAAPFTVEAQKLYITASIGISLFPNDGEDSGTLLKNADIAMYRAKELGKNTYQFYSSDMSARAFERLSLETSLRHALERQEFVLHYQPQVDSNTGRIVGVEALIRWQHPDFGIVPPADFIPLLEETGLIVPAGEWVLDSAGRQLRAWHEAGWPDLRLSVNLSPRQFHAAGLEAMIARGVERIGRDPGRLELEITEGVILSHTRASLDTLAALRALGVRLAVDDFGTGYSSLSYLRRFPIDTLKIDRSFVQDIPGDADDCAITATIIVLARNLKLSVIAEGVENEAQRDFLRHQGCHVMQGYLFSRPLPADEVTCLLERQRTAGRGAGGD